MLTYDMQRRGGMSLYEYLYFCVRHDIEGGVIAANEKLPSKRALAKHLGVSLITVEGAYTQLLAEGYIYAVQRKGYFANDVAPFATRAQGARFSREQGGDAEGSVCGGNVDALDVGCERVWQCGGGFASASGGDRPLVADFTGATAPRGLFPYKAWARVVRETLSRESEETLLASSGTMGSLRLRQALADYLRGQRGMDVLPDQIVVGAGAQTLDNMLVQLLGRDRHVAIEEPGYPRLTQIYLSNNVALSHVALDESGVSVEALRESGADVLHFMPSHQLPTGLVTPIGRRRELLLWAAEAPDRYIIEDDYDCEFRMSGRPIPSLQSIDANETVIYTNTFTNSLGPSFRIGYMVLPPHLARRFRDRLGFYSCTVGAIDQVALARYIESGDYERHVNRMRSHFRRVQEGLVEGLQASDAAAHLRFHNVGAGLHFVMEVDAGVPAECIMARARALGVALAPLERYCHKRTAERPALFVMNFASLSEGAIPDVVSALNKCFT